MTQKNDLKNAISQELFIKFATELEKNCGISLADHKKYLVESRLNPIVRDKGFSSIDELIQSFLSGKSTKNLSHQVVVDAMTTNETLWFRDNYPFEYLKNIHFKFLSKQGLINARVWSAACSTGQEPYSITMIFEDAKKLGLHTIPDIKVVATDISKNVIEKAKKGIYEKVVLARGMSEDYLEKCFKKIDNENWEVKEGIRAKIEFKEFNLMDRFDGLGKFDIVFCRNVLIYFSPALKEEILKKIHATLKPDGLLFLGSSESIAANYSHLFQMESANPGIFYRKK